MGRICHAGVVGLLVLDMLGLASEQLEILRGVIGRVPVNVMHNLSAQEWPPQQCFHDDAMF